jgi:hypothetical protein
MIPDNFLVERTVRFCTGPLQGLTGTIIHRRESGCYLVQLHEGIYVEADPAELDLTGPSTDAGTTTKN